MPTYVAMLRGINVSGQKKIKMDRLRELFVSSGFEAVESYVQSGNVVFDTARTGATALSEKIARGIKTEFGHDVSVVIRTPRELARVVKDNPFLKQRGIDLARLGVTFLAAAPRQAGRARLQAVDSGDDEWRLEGKEIYLHCPSGYGKTKLSNNLFERAFAVAATTRNWRTVNALLEMSTRK